MQEGFGLVRRFCCRIRCHGRLGHLDGLILLGVEASPLMLTVQKKCLDMLKGNTDLQAADPHLHDSPDDP